MIVHMLRVQATSHVYYVQSMDIDDDFGRDGSRDCKTGDAIHVYSQFIDLPLELDELE